MKAIKTGDPEKKKNRREKRAAKNGSLQSSSSFVFATDNSGLKGSCEDGNLRACKTKVKKTPKFNPNKSRLSKKKLVKAKKEKQPEQSNQERYSNPRFL